MHWAILHSHSLPPHELLRNQNESLNTWTSSGVNSWQTWHHTDVVSAEKESSQLKSDCRARCDSTASHRSPPAAPLSPELFWGVMERWLCFIGDCVIPQSCFVSRYFQLMGSSGAGRSVFLDALWSSGAPCCTRSSGDKHNLQVGKKGNVTDAEMQKEHDFNTYIYFLESSF